MVHSDPGRIRTRHRFRCPSCETATLNANVDYVHSCRFWSVKVSVVGSSLPNQVSPDVGWRCLSRANDLKAGSVRVKSWTG